MQCAAGQDGPQELNFLVFAISRCRGAQQKADKRLGDVGMGYNFPRSLLFVSSAGECRRKTRDQVRDFSFLLCPLSMKK